ncbi:MAG: hypothetical protein K2Q09_12320 [Phycisphaerales bacterium]|nr:hypothetical protein [Phycisphaerales bacterium]
MHVFIIESEVAGSTTSVRPTWNTIRSNLQAAGTLGQSMFVDAPTKADLHAAATAFAAWSGQVPKDDPVVLWLSVHGADPEPGVPDDQRKLVGTSGASSVLEEVDWEQFLRPVKGASSPRRITVLMDVCWGSSATAPARLETPAASRPYMVFGPVRSAFPAELALASHAVIGWIAKRGLPLPVDAKSLIDSLNTKCPPSQTTGTGWYRAWWWNDTGTIQMHPTSTKGKFKRK